MIMADLFSRDLIFKSCYLVLFTYPTTLEENMPLLKQDTWDNVVVDRWKFCKMGEIYQMGKGKWGLGGWMGKNTF